MTAVADTFAQPRRPGRARIKAMRDPRITPQLIAGLVMLAALLALMIIGSLMVDPENARVSTMAPAKPPTAEHILGSDNLGRDLWTVLVLGIPNTIRYGLIAGIVGLSVGL